MACAHLYRCDVCGTEIYIERHHCAECGDYDLCDSCMAAVGHQHPVQRLELDNAELVAECELSILKALQSVEPDATTLEECAASQDAGCAQQAAGTLTLLKPFRRRR